MICSGKSYSVSLRTFYFFFCLRMHLFLFITFISALRMLLWTAFSCSSRKHHLHWWLLVRNTHLAADRATQFMRQAAQGSAAPGLKHNSRSLASLTFASLGHGNSRARRRGGQAPFTQVFVWFFFLELSGHRMTERGGERRGGEGGHLWK